MLSDEKLVTAENGMLMTNQLARLFASVQETKPVGAEVVDVDTESYDEKLVQQAESFAEKEDRLRQDLKAQHERVNRLSFLIIEVQDFLKKEEEDKKERQKEAEQKQPGTKMVYEINAIEVLCRAAPLVQRMVGNYFAMN